MPRILGISDFQASKQRVPRNEESSGAKVYLAVSILRYTVVGTKIRGIHPARQCSGFRLGTSEAESNGRCEHRATEPGPESSSRLGSQVPRLRARYPTRNDVNEPENTTSFTWLARCSFAVIDKPILAIKCG